MAVIHLQRIKKAFHNLFDAHMDLSDYDGKSVDEREKAFLSRSVAAYGLTLLADVDPDRAANAVTDGFDDNGVDAVLFDEETSVLYVVQSKWIEDGNGSVTQGECKKFLDGFRDLVNLRLENFNDRVRSHDGELRSALLSADVGITLVLGHSGTQPLSTHVRRDIDAILAEMNDPVELLAFEHLDQSRIYNGIAGHAQRRSIKIEVMLQEWGYVEHPYPAYYGQVDAATIAQWWGEHGRNLFARNIRNFRGSTDVNDALASTLKSAPEHFWYFNNGVTVLCSEIAKKPLGGRRVTAGSSSVRV